jgi:hypothetical protein
MIKFFFIYIYIHSTLAYAHQYISDLFFLKKGEKPNQKLLLASGWLLSLSLRTPRFCDVSVRIVCFYKTDFNSFNLCRRSMAFESENASISVHALKIFIFSK